MLASHALALVGVPMRRVIRLVQEQRDARYQLLRGYFHGADDGSPDEWEHERLASVTLPATATCINQMLQAQALAALGVHVLSLRRSQGNPAVLDEQLRLQAGDTLVLCGSPKALALAEAHLLNT